MKRWIMAQALLGGGTTWKIRPIIPSIVVTTPTSLEHHHITHQQPSSSTTTITRYYYYSSSTYHPTLEQPPSKSMSTSFQSWFGLVFIRNQFWKYSTSATTATNTRTLTVLRGGGGDGNDGYNNHNNNHNATTEDTSHTEPQNSTKFTVLSDPAPGSPFHYAFPVHDLHLAKEFYGTILGCVEGRSSTKWQDYSLHGHQIVAHWVGDNYRCQDYYNPVDGDEVPVPHTGLALTVEQFHELANRLRQAGVEFIIEPHLRFRGMPGEQYTMFFKDPSGNNLEFKAMTNPQYLFAKYNVDDK